MAVTLLGVKKILRYIEDNGGIKIGQLSLYSLEYLSVEEKLSFLEIAKLLCVTEAEVKRIFADNNLRYG